MQHLRMTSRPPLGAAPTAFRLLAASEHVREARMVAMNPADDRGVTALVVVDGDRAAVEAGLADAGEVLAADTAPAGDGRFFLLATLSPEDEPLMRAVFETVTRDGLVVLTPVVYRDGAVHARLVGESATVGDALEALPAAVAVEVHEVGERGLTAASAGAALSDRQRAAVLSALELGYYDRPRRATHGDVAAELGCAPSTASEHLQKAEAKLVRAAMGGGRTDR